MTKQTLKGNKAEVSDLRKELYSTTPIHGFGFIQNSKQTFEIAFWYLLLVIFLGKTIWDVYDLHDQYINHPTMTSVTMKFNKTLKTPVMFFCINNVKSRHFHVQRTEKGKLPINGSDGKVLFYAEVHKILKLETYLSNLLENTTKEQFLGPDKWDFALFEAVYQYFESLSFVEWATSNQMNAKDFNTEAAKVLQSYTEFRGISQKSLFDRFGEEIIGILLIQGPFGIPTGHQLAHVFEGNVCFKLEPRLPLAMDVDHSFAFYMNTEGIPIYEKTRTASLLFDSQDDGPEHMWSMKKLEKFESKQHSFTRGIVDISTVINALENVRGEQRCSLDQSRHQCQLKCHADFIESQCHCLAFYARDTLFSHDKRPCTLHIYDQCYRTNTVDYSQCKEHCLPKCTTWTYRVSGITEMSSKDRSTKTGIEFRFGSFFYPQYDESIAVTWESFLGGCGGTMGLYLGVSFLSLIHLFLWTVKTIFLKCKLRTERTSKIPNGIYFSKELPTVVVKY